MVLVESVITYDGLPVSSGGGHSVRSRSPVETWRAVSAFMAACTDNPAPSTVDLDVLTGDAIPSSFSGPLLEQLTAELGPSAPHDLGPDTGHVWSITADRIVHFAEMIERLRPLPVHPYKLPPVCVGVRFQFRLLSPRSGQPLPDQDPSCYNSFGEGYSEPLGVSLLYARLSERSTVSLFLTFPFQEVAEPFQESARFVQNNLPFRLSKFHWKMWRLAKNGRRYVGRKIPPPTAVA